MLPLDAQNYMRELQYIKYAAYLNGYDENVIDGSVVKHSKAIRKRNMSSLFSQMDGDVKKRIAVHFAPEVTNKLKKVFGKFKIELAFKTNKLKDFLGTTKDKTENVDKTGIYEVACGDCNKKYIGQTRRSIMTRFKEHVKINVDVRSAVGEHIVTHNHRVPKQNLKLRKHVTNFSQLDAYESIFMYKEADSLMNAKEAPIRSTLFHFIE